MTSHSNGRMRACVRAFMCVALHSDTVAEDGGTSAVPVLGDECAGSTWLCHHHRVSVGSRVHHTG